MHPLLPDLEKRPERTALRTGGTTISFGELARAARAHAGRLAAEGIRRGDRVAVWATPDPSTVAAVVGNALAGVATVPLNPALGKMELRHVLADAAPGLVLAADAPAFAGRAPGVRPIALDGPAAAPPAPSPAVSKRSTAGCFRRIDSTVRLSAPIPLPWITRRS